MPLEIQAATGNALSDIEYISQGEKELYKCWMKLSLQSVHFTFTRSLSISVMQLILKFYFYFWFFLLFFGSYLAVLWGRVGRCSARTFPTGFILFDFSCLDAGPAELLDLSQRGFPFFAAGHLLPGSQAVVRRVSHQHQQHSEKYLLPFVGKRLSLPQPSYSNQHPPPPPGRTLCFLKIASLTSNPLAWREFSYLTGQRQILRVVSYFYSILFVCFLPAQFFYTRRSRGKTEM